MTHDKSFAANQIITFNRIITNTGGGYIDDVNNADYGKFIAPKNGTYQFSASFYDENTMIGADLRKNGEEIIGASNGGGGPANLTAILELKERDEVYLLKPDWMPNNELHNKYFTSFSGSLSRSTI